jgi:hypothetical protein
MRKFSLYFLSISLVFLFCNCSKSTPATNTITHDTVIITHDTVELVSPLNPIVGFWVGTQIPGDGSTTTPLYYSFDIRPDSTLLMQGEGGDGSTLYGIGTWKLNGTAFTAVITTSNLSQAGAKQNITAVYDNTKGTLASGTIQTIGYPYTTTFSMTRQN